MENRTDCNDIGNALRGLNREVEGLGWIKSKGNENIEMGAIENLSGLSGTGCGDWGFSVVAS